MVRVPTEIAPPPHSRHSFCSSFNLSGKVFRDIFLTLPCISFMPQWLCALKTYSYLLVAQLIMLYSSHSYCIPVCSNAPVPLCRICSRTWTNVKSLKFAPIPVGERTNEIFFNWARFFLDNSKITIRHVWSQVNKVRVIFANEHE